MEQGFRLILASQSPRRRELLGKMGYVFETCSPDVDENVDLPANEAVMELARRKAMEAAKAYEDGVIIASDTLVSLNSRPLGKPADAQDAKRMLLSLSGCAHEVYTGVCLLDAKTGALVVRKDCTRVFFRDLTEGEIEQYISTGEPMDKAGAYAIQGGAGRFVEHIEGSFENVMGFPVDLVREMLDQFTKG